MTRVYYILFALLVVPCGVFADFTDILEGNGSYPIIAQGKTQKKARSLALSQAEKIAKKDGKEFSIAQETYEQLSNGTYTCKLQVEFHPASTLESERGCRRPFRIPALGRDKQSAEDRAMGILEFIKKMTGKEFELLGEVCFRLPKCRMWLCCLKVRVVRPNMIQLEKVMGVSCCKKEAEEEAFERLQKISQKTGKEFRILSAVYTPVRVCGDKKSWLCVLNAVFRSPWTQVDEGEFGELAAFQVPGSGEDQESARANAMATIEELTQTTGEQITILKEEQTQSPSGEYYCLLTVRYGN